ncbi:hypothetical protein EJ07DRAFT_143078 [Lizonia empirigonia]|nr:hypothetical protein EJ07DRAFT_143078 [Lizonia empirigonia]
MAVTFPLRLLQQKKGVFSVLAPCYDQISHFDILSYDRDPLADRTFDCEIPGVDWKVSISPRKIESIMRFMATAEIEYLWADCLCIKQDDEQEKRMEIAKMCTYYQAAHTCHILVDMPTVWHPQQTVDDLKNLDHILFYTSGAAIASEVATLSEHMKRCLESWISAQWTFPQPRQAVRMAAIDMGILNCYSMCVRNVMSFFDNPYFKRLGMFQEMILGKNVVMWAGDEHEVSSVGALNSWLDLATDTKDKALKLLRWIETSRVVKSESVASIMRVIEEDVTSLETLQSIVMGIDSARIDVISGGPSWWQDNPKGVSNIFSLLAVMPREFNRRAEVFKGLLGLFSGLYTDEEAARELSGEDFRKISFNFFKRLSSKTGFAWTNLAVRSGEISNHSWVPVVEAHVSVTTTKCFAGIYELGILDAKGRVDVEATDLEGTPRQLASIRVVQGSPDDANQFTFEGCNGAKTVKQGSVDGERTQTNNRLQDINSDDMGRILAQCATILGSLLEPDASPAEYRRSLLRKLQPQWRISDPNAKPKGWEDRCVSGTFWEAPHPHEVKVHSRSFNYRMVDLFGFDCREETEHTKQLSGEVEMSCGCIYRAPLLFILQGLTAVRDSLSGDPVVTSGKDGRIVMQEGLGLVQICDVGRTFSLVAFGQSEQAEEPYASLFRGIRSSKRVGFSKISPSGRALVSEGFSHGLLDKMRGYGYVETGGSGGLLISRSHLADSYRIIGVCIDKRIVRENGGTKTVKIC